MRNLWSVLIYLGLAACGLPPPEPTPGPPPTSVPSATPSSLPSLTPTALPSATPLPSVTPSRFILLSTFTRLPPRTLAPVTGTATPMLLAPVVWDNRLDVLGVRLVRATPSAGNLYWRLVKAEFWDEKERQGKRHIFVDVLDENGARILGQEILVEWPGDRLVIVTQDKPALEYTANFPLDESHYPPWGTLGAFDVSIKGLPSDKIAGHGLATQKQIRGFFVDLSENHRAMISQPRIVILHYAALRRLAAWDGDERLSQF